MRIHALHVVLLCLSILISHQAVTAGRVALRAVHTPLSPRVSAGSGESSEIPAVESTGETGETGVTRSEEYTSRLRRIKETFGLEAFHDVACRIQEFEVRHLEGRPLPTSVDLKRTVPKAIPTEYPKSLSLAGLQDRKRYLASLMQKLYDACKIFRAKGFKKISNTAFSGGSYVWSLFEKMMRSQRIELIGDEYKRVATLGWFYDYWEDGGDWNFQHIRFHSNPLLKRLQYSYLWIRASYPPDFPQNLPVHPIIYYLSLFDEIVGKLDTYDNAIDLLDQKCDLLNSDATIHSPLLQRVIDDFIAPYMVFNGRNRSEFHWMTAHIISRITAYKSWHSGAYSPPPVPTIMALNCFWLTMTAYLVRQMCPEEADNADKILQLTRYVARHVARKKEQQLRCVLAELVRTGPRAFNTTDMHRLVNRMAPEAMYYGSPVYFPSTLL